MEILGSVKWNEKIKDGIHVKWLMDSLHLPILKPTWVFNVRLTIKTYVFLLIMYSTHNYIFLDKPSLKVEEKKMHIIAEGLDGQVSCAMEANPVPSETFWSKNGLILKDNKRERFSINGNVLQFSNASVDDTGMYACWAENVVGRSDIYEMHGKSTITAINNCFSYCGGSSTVQ